MTTFNQEEREERVQKVLKYAESMFKRRNQAFDEMGVITELGAFVSRSQGLLLLLVHSHAVPMLIAQETSWMQVPAHSSSSGVASLPRALLWVTSPSRWAMQP